MSYTLYVAAVLARAGVPCAPLRMPPSQHFTWLAG